MDLFLLKKIITVLIMPINVVLILLILALVLFHKKPKFSMRSLLAATVILGISSFAPFSDSVMTAIENDYSSYIKTNQPVDYIVVLGCRHNNNYDLPPTEQLANCSLQRMVEALRIYKLHPEARIITSGHAGNNLQSNAETVKEALVLLGVPEHKVITENFPKDTQEEAELIAPRVQGTKVVLVTNADHMPRSINYFKSQGINPIAAPAGYWVKNPEGEKSWAHFSPSSNKLNQTTTAWYESLGLLVQWVKSVFS